MWDGNSVCLLVAITNYHLLGDNRNLCFHNSGGWKTRMEMPAGLVSGDTVLPHLQRAAFYCVLRWLFLCVCSPLVSLSLLREILFHSISRLWGNKPCSLHHMTFVVLEVSLVRKVTLWTLWQVPARESQCRPLGIWNDIMPSASEKYKQLEKYLLEC